MSRVSFVQRVQQLNMAGFLLFLGLLLISHSYAENRGPFGWQPFALPGNLPDWQIGPLNILPILVVVVWGLCWGLNWRHLRTSWFFGEKVVTLPLLAITLLSLTQITSTSDLVWIATLFLVWFVYLFRLNTYSLAATAQPGKKLFLYFLIIVITIQAGTGIAQFVRQQSVGLVWLGELSLNTSEIGTSVTRHNGANWLRAYGLNSHPNQFGLLLVMLLLLLLPWLFTKKGSWRLLASLAWLVGFAGLVVSLSRSAWLALTVGLLVYALAWVKAGRRGDQRPLIQRYQWLFLGIMAAGLLSFADSYGDTIARRLFRLETPLESRSLFERQRDINLSFYLISEHPWQGVGQGHYQIAARQLDSEAQPVHNVPLLVAAEFGLPGLIIWLTFLFAPLTLLGKYGFQGPFVPATAVWLALITFSLFQPEPTLFLVKGAVIWGLAASLWTLPAPNNLKVRPVLWHL